MYRGDNKMYCEHCGNLIDRDSIVCYKCNYIVEENAIMNNKKAENQKSKEINTNGDPKVAGILLSLFMGIFGLVIGVCIYPEKTIRRNIFLKYWTIIFVIELITATMLVLTIYFTTRYIIYW